MFDGSLCGGMGAAGWIVMITFWGAFVGLAVWAVSRLVATPANDGSRSDAMDTLDRRLAAGEVDPETYRRLRDELSLSSR